MENDRYFARSWALLTCDKGWIKPLLVMAAASLVPIAGPLGVKGYGLEWGRLTAWGVDSAPKQKNVDVGGCIASGWRGFVVDLGLGLILGLASVLLGSIVAVFPGVLGALLGGIVGLALAILSVLWVVALTVAELRAAIYERIGAGYRLDRVFEMIKRDLGGFMRVFLVNLACSAVLSVAGMILGMIAATMCMPLIVALVSRNEYAALTALSQVMGPLVLFGVIFGYVLLVLGSMARLITVTAAGLWMRQFDVPAWGRSEDPLPQPGVSSYAPPQQRQEPPQWRQEPVPQPEQEDKPAMDEAKDVDELYADLYDVIQRNNRTDDEDKS